VSYLVLARKWRPQTFDDIVGQEVATRSLTNAMQSRRIAHAYLFTGARGVGKTTAARILAKALNCERGPTPAPCNECPLCEEVTNGRSVDVLEIDGASNTGVDDVRDLRDKVKYLPARARYKVLIIDEVHMLSQSAFNALLKTLEEPPAHVVFVFATTEPHKIPATVLSRVQRYDFRRIAHAKILERLQTIAQAEGLAAAPGALSIIAREAEGSMRDALSLLDQAWSSSAGGDLSEAAVSEALGVVDTRTLFGVAKALLSRDGAACLKHVDTVFHRGHDMRQFAAALLQLLRDVAVSRVSNDASLFDRADHEIAEMRAIAAPHEPATLYRTFDGLAKAFDELARAAYPKLLLEMTLLRLATAEPLRPLADALSKLEALERRLSPGRIESPRAQAPLRAAGETLPRDVAMRVAEARAALEPHAASASAVAPSPPKPATPASAPETAPPAVPAPAATKPPAEKPEDTTPTHEIDARVAWREIVSRVSTAKRSLGAVFGQARLVRLDARELEVAFAEPFLLETAQEGAAMALFTTVAREVVGAPVRVRLTKLDEGAAPLPPSIEEERREQSAAEREATRRELGRHPNVVAAQDLLGARLVEVRLSDEERRK
jgi:DNA polymerase-3 subunit gamma/tau